MKKAYPCAVSQLVVFKLSKAALRGRVELTEL